MRKILPALLLSALPGMAGAADRAKAEVTCLPAQGVLVYDCLVRLSHAGTNAAIPGAEISVGADMPSMPMAHNMAPVAATAVKGEPGIYQFRLELEMQGVWALKIGVARPFRDMVVSVLEFGEKAVQPKR